MSRTPEARALEEEARRLLASLAEVEDRRAFAAQAAGFKPPLPEILIRMREGRPYEDLLPPSKGPRRPRLC